MDRLAGSQHMALYLFYWLFFQQNIKVDVIALGIFNVDLAHLHVIWDNYYILSFFFFSFLLTLEYL